MPKHCTCFIKSCRTKTKLYLTKEKSSALAVVFHFCSGKQLSNGILWQFPNFLGVNCNPVAGNSVLFMKHFSRYISLIPSKPLNTNYTMDRTLPYFSRPLSSNYSSQSAQRVKEVWSLSHICIHYSIISLQMFLIFEVSLFFFTCVTYWNVILCIKSGKFAITICCFTSKLTVLTYTILVNQTLQNFRVDILMLSLHAQIFSPKRFKYFQTLPKNWLESESSLIFKTMVQTADIFDFEKVLDIVFINVTTRRRS